MYWEDADYCRRVADLGSRRAYVPLVSVRHVAGQAAAREPAFAVRAFHRSAYRMYRKHASAAGRMVAPLVHAGLWLRGELLAISRK
jgi:GT2 family glycosyltransferase